MGGKYKMKLIHKLLLLPFLAPLIGVIAIALMNMNQPVKLKVLTWTSPKISIGKWMLIASTSSALLSFASSLSTQLIEYPNSKNNEINKTEDSDYNSINNTINEDYDLYSRQRFHDLTHAPERELRQPAPTVEVPYRVLRGNTTVEDNDQYEEDDYYYAYDDEGNERELAYNPDNEYTETEQSYRESMKSFNSEEHGEDKSKNNDDWQLSIEEDW